MTDCSSLVPWQSEVLQSAEKEKVKLTFEF